MAVYKIFPKKDATVYTEYPMMNTGFDEILELKPISAGKHHSEVLLDFNLEEFDEIYYGAAKRQVPDYRRFRLKLFIAQALNLPTDVSVMAYNISQSWTNGTGKFKDEKAANNGVSYKYSTNYELWDEENPSLSSPTYYSTPFSWVNIGLYTTKDIVMDVTSLISSQQIMDYPNGIILKCFEGGINFGVDKTDEVKTEYEKTTGPVQYSLSENKYEYYAVAAAEMPPYDIVKAQGSSLIKSHNESSLKYFSRDTHTIYPPCLEMLWDDSDYNTFDNSLETVYDSDLYINISNNKGEFNENSVNKFRINVRPKNLRRRFVTTYETTDNFLLPEDSCYAIKDVDTNEFVIDFDESYTKLSCDEKGGYFNLYMKGLQPERYYEILIKTNINEEVVILSNKMYFKIKKSINNFFPER